MSSTYFTNSYATLKGGIYLGGSIVTELKTQCFIRYWRYRQHVGTRSNIDAPRSIGATRNIV